MLVRRRTRSAAVPTGVLPRSVGRHERQDRKTELRRCAIYTRVSTEYGLEQNSTRSTISERLRRPLYQTKAHEGWKLIRDHYDDGGFWWLDGAPGR